MVNFEKTMIETAKADSLYLILYTSAWSGLPPVLTRQIAPPPAQRWRLETQTQSCGGQGRKTGSSSSPTRALRSARTFVKAGEESQDAGQFEESLKKVHTPIHLQDLGQVDAELGAELRADHHLPFIAFVQFDYRGGSCCS